MTIQDIQLLYLGICALDKRDAIIKDKQGKEQVVSLPYRFSGKTAWNLAKNRMILKRYVDVLNDTRDQIIKQVSGSDRIEVSNQEQVEAFSKEIAPVLKQQEKVEGLLKIKIEELNLGENPISPSVLESIASIIDDTK
jgi:hypothetical protein